MPDETELDSDSKLVNYNSNMELPEWSDKQGILKFLGVDDEMSQKILLKYGTIYDSDPQPLNQPLQVPYRKTPYAPPEEIDGKPTMVTYWDFPLVERLVELYRAREDGLSPDYYNYEENYGTFSCPQSNSQIKLTFSTDSYINSAVKDHGLRPEFAIRCGLHPDEPSYDKWEEEEWYKDSPGHYANEVVEEMGMMLTRLWRQKLEKELAVANGNGTSHDT
jgi:hypothetical protein